MNENQKQNQVAKQVALTSSDLQKIPKELQVFNTAQVKLIIERTPSHQIKKRQGKGGQVWQYVNGAYCTKLLNMVFGFNWDFTIKKHEFDLTIGQAYVLGQLKVKIGKTKIIKQQFGRADIKFLTETRNDDTGKLIMDDFNPNKPKRFKTMQPVDIGNDLKAAATDALKKCASSMGFFSDVYYAEDFKDIKVVSEEQKKDIKVSENFKTVKFHLDNCKSIENVEAVEKAFFEANNGDANNDLQELIKEYKIKFSDE